jgi:hypothetical protein
MMRILQIFQLMARMHARTHARVFTSLTLRLGQPQVED